MATNAGYRTRSLRKALRLYSYGVPIPEAIRRSGARRSTVYRLIANHREVAENLQQDEASPGRPD
jgi:transposase